MSAVNTRALSIFAKDLSHNQQSNTCFVTENTVSFKHRALHVLIHNEPRGFYCSFMPQQVLFSLLKFIKTMF